MFQLNDDQVKAISIEDLTSILVTYFEEVKQVSYRDGNKDLLPNIKQLMKNNYE
jgi:hypothetical protein